MADTKKILGVCIVKIDGAKYRTVPGTTTIGFGGRSRSTEVADETIQYKDGPLMAAFVETEFQHTAGTDITKLNNCVGALVEIETDINVTYTIPNATRVGEPIQSTDSNGHIKWRAEGDPVPGL